MAYTKYYYVHLPRAMQPLYDAVLQGMMQFENEIHLPAISPEDVNRLLTALDLDNPALFHVAFGKISFVCQADEVILQVRYAHTCTQARTLRARINARAYDLLKQTAGMGLTEKELFLQDKLISGKTYGVTPGREQDAQSLVGAMLDGVCTGEGVAKAFKYLCDLAQLTAIVAVGTAEGAVDGEMQAWNIVFHNGFAYRLDVTRAMFDRCGETAFRAC